MKWKIISLKRPPKLIKLCTRWTLKKERLQITKIINESGGVPAVASWNESDEEP